MSSSSLVQCEFLVPLRRDAEISDGEPHEGAMWDWLTRECFKRFGGLTQAPGLYVGHWRSPSGHAVTDESRMYIVAVRPKDLPRLRKFLALASAQFKQRCLYLCVAGYVEFIEARP